ncbi:MAG: hypothetical protein C4329_14505 [Chitinophagaceae bacterium]
MQLMTPSWVLIIWTLFLLDDLALWLITLIDIVRSEFSGRNEKLLWELIVLLAPFLGVILYYFTGRKNKLKFS